MDHPEIVALQSVPWRDESDPNWVRVRNAMHSGAAVGVAPPSMAPGIPIEDSPGSRRGQHFLSASKDRLPTWDSSACP